jgi:hypothetical protein
VPDLVAEEGEIHPVGSPARGLLLLWERARCAQPLEVLGELLAEDVEAYQLRLWEAEERRSWTYTWTGVRVKKPFFP